MNIEEMLPVGTLLNSGRYKVVRHLSSGGFGKTYVVCHLSLNKDFAMKEFFMKGVNLRNGANVGVSTKEGKTSFDSQKKKFQKEARRIGELHHPNIVRVHDLFEEYGTCYYVMDYIEGESLSERLERTKAPILEQEIMVLLDQILSALQEIHQQGLAHMDLKPANVMQDKHGNVYLIDFGASKQMTTEEQYTLSQASVLTYTKGYAPPEQMDCELTNVGPWTDLYSLGATLYNLMTLKNPPTNAKLITEPEHAFDFSKISPRMQFLIQWMMTPNRKKRPQSVKEVVDYLHTKNSSYSKSVGQAENVITNYSSLQGYGGDTTLLDKNDNISYKNSSQEQTILCQSEKLPVGFELNAPEAHYKILRVHEQMDYSIVYIAQQIYPKVVTDKEFIIYESFLKEKDKRMRNGYVESTDGTEVNYYSDWDVVGKRNYKFAEETEVWGMGSRIKGAIKYSSSEGDIDAHRFVLNNTFYFALKYENGLNSNLKMAFWGIVSTLLVVAFIGIIGFVIYRIFYL